MSESLLHVHRWRNEYRVGRDHPEPGRVRADLDRIGEGLPEELAKGLESWLSTAPDRVVLIERLAFDCELDLSQPRWTLTRRQASRFAQALVDAVESGEGVLRFPTPAAYRARFVADLAAGGPRDAWYYRPFAGLGALPASAAIRTVLLEDAELGRATLAALTPGDWLHLASTLTPRETVRVLDGLAREGTVEGDVAGVVASFVRAREWLPSGASPETRSLATFIAAAEAGLAPTRELGGLARLLARLPGLAASSRPAPLRDALSRGDSAALASLDPVEGGEIWAALEGRPAWRPLLLGALDRLTEETRPPAGEEASPPTSTAFGGLALLLPELDGLLSPEVSAALPPSDLASPRNLVAWLALALCSGRGEAGAFVREAFWRDVFAIPPRVDRPTLESWLGGASAAPVRERVRSAVLRLVRGQPLVVPLRFEDRRLLVEVDDATGLWIGRGLSRRPVRWRTRLATARRLRQDALFLHGEWLPPGEWGELLTQLAQSALRRLAYRIPGFGSSSLSHLRANVLSGTARWDRTSGRLQLERPPLHALLSLTGLARGALVWSGPPERTLRLEYVS